MTKELDITKEILNILIENGEEGYLVGGSVRDYLLYDHFSDIDIAVSCPPEKTIEIFNLKKYRKDGMKFGMVGFDYKGYNIEMTTFRIESNYKKRSPQKIVFVKSPKEDSVRRDFTINALYMDINGKIYDYYDGLTDLKNKRIRMVGDIKIKIIEDPVRILRALRFSLKHKLQIEEKLEKYIKENIDLINVLSKQRIKKEISKMYKENDSEKVNNLLNEYGVYTALFNEEVDGCKDFHEVLKSIEKRDTFCDINDWVKN